MKKLLLLLAIVAMPSLFYAQKGNKKKTDKTDNTEKENTKKEKGPNIGALKFRCIGPAFASGRISDIAVNPKKTSEYYVAVASGNLWKTTNAGTTYVPIFENKGSYSIGCVTLAPSNESIVWVGTGENNNQRSVAYGDGVYKSNDGGKSFKNMGLKTSEHIGMIKVHPTNPNIVYVAAYGPLWSEGGERGLYKTEDAGKTWKAVLEIDTHTGVSEVHMDPRNPEVLYAVSHQRRRHVFTYLGGGPGSGIHKSEDGGKSWNKLAGGLPFGDYLGRIGLAISPANPDYVYAIVEATKGKKGTYRSTNRGASWTKMSSYSTSGNYYQEIYCDLYDKDKVFSMNTWFHHSEDGGKTFKRTGEKHKHVDNHCMWIDPLDTDHWIVGCDGGIYETWNHATDWQFKANLPVTQFYKVAVDNAEPFYNVYGGTQDNNSMGGPSRTTNSAGIVNADWYITNGGDGFESQIDPKDPNIVYAQAQYGWIVRYDKKSGEAVGIKPGPGEGEAAFRWNWDAPLLISPHNHKRLYFCANKVFRSENRGDDWVAISDDLTQQLDRNKMPVMDRVWSADAVMKNKSTSIYGNIVAMDESPLQENLIYIGTDDGLIQVTEDAKTWTKVAQIAGVPTNTYVNALITSQHDKNTVYAVFNNHKQGDFKPYIYKSTDKGATWTVVHGDLPERGSVYDIAEDHVDKNLLFAGTEFGVFYSKNGGENWSQLKSGIPTIAIRDIEIQKRESDLVLASFGRGFYVLDDYSPLRNYKEEDKEKLAVLYPIKDAWIFIERAPLGLTGTSMQGESYYAAPNPPVGAVFSYLFSDTTMMTSKDARYKREAKLIKEEADIPYPTLDELHKEDWEQKPYAIMTISNKRGEVVRRLKTTPTQGLNRLVWNFRYESLIPVKLKESKPGRYGSGASGALAAPGQYFAQLSKVHDGKVTLLTEKIAFNIKSLNNATLAAEDKLALEAFEIKLSKMRRAGRGVSSVFSSMSNRVEHLQKGIILTPDSDLKLLETAEKLRLNLKKMSIELHGDGSLSAREFEATPGLLNRMESPIWNMWDATSAPSKTAQKNYEIVGKMFEQFLKDMTTVKKEINNLEKQLNDLGGPYTPGRIQIPDWKME
jgi:photosystem II stability/assembly factor-like uncharacterized protein